MITDKYQLGQKNKLTPLEIFKTVINKSCLIYVGPSNIKKTAQNYDRDNNAIYLRAFKSHN